MFPASMRPATRLAIALVLGHMATARAEDLPPELVARPATLPHGVVALTLAGGYDSAHVLGIPVLSATTLGLLLQRGMTSRLELSLGTGLAVHPDAGWTRDGSFALAYRAWHRDSVRGLRQAADGPRNILAATGETHETRTYRARSDAGCRHGTRTGQGST